uniref:Uncharacterized protein n=1 Tax=Vespula pensylvanica TaxID=30213 RepID=A0A834NWK0_VESPE|nr:hypothetical protein H0235_010121 [Vespula pensylvanica]
MSPIIVSGYLAIRSGFQEVREIADKTRSPRERNKLLDEVRSPWHGRTIGESIGRLECRKNVGKVESITRS